MTLPPLTYLTVDSLTEGVGASQVLPYVERLSQRGLRIRLHSCEEASPGDELVERLMAAAVEWHAHRFGRPGALGGLTRVLRLARAARGAELVHARGDLAALAAMMSRSRPWVWDMRAFFADQRIELGMLRPGSPEERLLRLVERRAARSSDAIVTLAAAAVPVLERRHGAGIATKATVIPTCADLDRFRPAPMPGTDELHMLFSGSLNQYYDVPVMLDFFRRSRDRGPTTLTVLSPGATSWDPALAEAGVERRTARPAEVPEHVAAAHVGLGVCRTDVGDSLRAAMPTKLAEFLAAGRPIVVNPGLGDMDGLLARHRCGVILRGAEPASLDDALDQLAELLADPATPTRCRQLAEEHFDLDDAVDDLLGIYERLAGA